MKGKKKLEEELKICSLMSKEGGKRIKKSGLSKVTVGGVWKGNMTQ